MACEDRRQRVAVERGAQARQVVVVRREREGKRGRRRFCDINHEPQASHRPLTGAATHGGHAASGTGGQGAGGQP